MVPALYSWSKGISGSFEGSLGCIVRSGLSVKTTQKGLPGIFMFNFLTDELLGFGVEFAGGW